MTAPRTSPELQADMADVADLFDAEFYAAAYPTVATRTDDLLRHFCTYGWRELRKPNRGFDVWWYWTNYLDPATEAVNPLVHYARTGRAAGHSTAPDPRDSQGGVALAPGRPVRRACLFAGFDADSRVDESVLVYLRDLARFADVFCLFDNYLAPEELEKLRGVVTEAWAIRHGAYDFGSYSLLARDLVGWDRLSAYDEVLFVNDSCYLLKPLDEVFTRMDGQVCDWWGMQATKGIAMTRDSPSNQFTEPIPLDVVRRDLLTEFESDPVYDFLVGSFFMAFRRPVLDDPVFRTLVNSVSTQSSKLAIIQKYEIGLTHVLIGRGHAFSTFIPALYPFHPMFTTWAFELIARGLPLLKRYFLYQNHYDTPGLDRWKERVLELVPQAPVLVFEENLLRTAPADRLQRSYAIRCDPDGTVHVPQVSSGAEFVRRDKAAPKRPDWWVFAVDPVTHTLPENSRAIFDQVSENPDLTKIVLTRSRGLQLPGTNVVTQPLLSPEGRERLLGAGTVFVAAQPTKALGVRAQLSLHQVIAVRAGLQLLKHGRTAEQPRHPGHKTPPATGPLPMLHPAAKPLVSALLTASDVDQLAEVSSQWPARYADVWRTGLPAHDYLLTSDPAPHLLEQEERLRRLLSGRRLLLFTTVGRGAGPGRTPYPFSRAEVEHLSSWVHQHDGVIGIREPLGDLERPYSVAFGELALDLSPGRFPLDSAVLRCTDVLLTDYDGLALDFMLTGRPVISFAHDLEFAADRLLYDLDHLFPGPVCRDFESLSAALDTVFDPPSRAAVRQYSRVRDLLIDHRDGQNAARVVRRVRDVLEGELA